MNEEKVISGESIRKFFLDNTGYIAVAFIAIAYIATSMITLGETGKTIAKIVGDGVAAFLVGVLITRSFSLQGIVRGNNDDRVIKAREMHSEQIFKVEAYIDKLDDWCDKKTATALRRERTKILAVNSMRYIDFFDEDGVAKPYTPLPAPEERKPKKVYKKLKKAHKKREESRVKCYEKAVALSITPLSASVLTGGKYKADDPYNFGQDIDDYEKANMKRDVISKLLIGLVFGYYVVELLSGISVADTLWKVFQLCIFCGGGAIQMMRSFMYMTDRYCKRLLQLTGRLREFEAAQANIIEIKEEKEDGE